MKVLITGGSGFIGSNMAELLLREGHEVTCMDNLSASEYTTIEPFFSNPRFKFIEHDICDPFPAEVGGYDRIYNMACPASPVHYQRDPIQTMKTCFIGTLNLLELARRDKSRILITSTSEVYGDPAVHPQAEGYWGNVNCVGRRSCYDEGKRVAETLCMDHYRQYGTNVRIARIFNTYGPRMLFHDGRVVSNFIVQALKKQPLSIYGNGSQTRSFCYIDDLLAGLIGLMECESGFIGPVNLGNPDEFTIAELADLVITMMDSKAGLEWRTLPSDDPRCRCPDTSLALKELGWKPTVSLREGLARTIADFTERAQKRPESLYCVHQAEARECKDTDVGDVSKVLASHIQTSVTTTTSHTPNTDTKDTSE